jgi:DNA adenine methylase
MSHSNAASEPIDFSTEEKIVVRPFLKWVGGKSQLIPNLIHRLPQSFKNYIEPFTGGGALFFHLQPAHAILADINSELINAYLAIRDDVEGVIKELLIHKYEKDYFYEVRSWDRLETFSSLHRNKRAARLIYLNKTCFNGLYRVNSKGHFNVPFGKYTNPTITNSDNLRKCSQVLQGVELKCEEYRKVAESAKAGDLVYFDPPYMPLSSTSNFTAYTKNGFDEDAQSNLMELCKSLDKKGVYFMLSNSSAPLILDLYKNFYMDLIEANRSINSVGSSRGPVHEVIVRNF